MAGDGEFDFIRERLRPLTGGDRAALDLADDAAVMTPLPGHDLVLACDTLVAGVHFLATDAPDVVASRALRSNLSDLAAMGATPLAYLSAMSWPNTLDAGWRAAFTTALHDEQDRFGLVLIGGDTTSTPGPLTLSLTLVGQVPTGAALQRATAGQDDDVWVSGVIGDGLLGLEAARTGSPALNDCLARYQRPDPRLGLGQALRGVASAVIDVSDGLLADASHLAGASRCRLVLDIDAVPVSATAAAWRDAGGGLERLVTGGDDYELLFTAPPTQREAIAALAVSLTVPLTRIGRVEAGEGIEARCADGSRMNPPNHGFTHF